MDLQVVNLSKDLVLNNSVYLSPQLAKNPKSTVNIVINNKILKCSFNDDIPMGKIGMSVVAKDLLGINTGNSNDKIRVKALPYDQKEGQETGLSFLELQLYQIQPKVDPSAKVNINDSQIIQNLRQKQGQFFFNLGESKYLKIKQTIYQLQVTKCLLVLTGSANQGDKTNKPGKLVAETQIQLKLPKNSPLILQSKQSQGKSIFRPDFTLQDMGIGGLDQELFNIFRRTFASRRYSASTIKKFGIKHVKGILLYGPPGTGKTLIARQLAKALNVKDLKIVNGPQIFSKFVGQSEQNIRKLFAEAREDQNKLGDKSPLHIIVFDQIDAICKQRGMNSGTGSQVTDQVVNQLLTNIDGVQALNNIIVIGMTNRKDLLDQAILRPGRFEVHIEVNLPNQEGRLQILKIHTKQLRLNNLLSPNCKLDELARLTKNFTGAEIEALIKSASSYSISRTTNILDFSKQLIIDQKNLNVEMQDFLKALQQVKPQFGVDEQRFGTYFRERIINYGSSFDKIMGNLHEVTTMSNNSQNQKRSVLITGRPGTGKTTIAVNYIKHCPFSYLKIISPQTYVGMSDNQKIRSITKIFEDAYRTTNACILIDNLQRLVDYCSIGRRFTNSVLQALLLLLQKSPPKQNCKLLIIGTTSSYYNLDQVDLSSRFDVRINIDPLTSSEIESFLVEKYGMREDVASKIGSLIKGATIKNVVELAELVDDKSSFADWQFFWQNLVSPQDQMQIA